LTRAQAEAQLVDLLGVERTKRFAELSVLAPTFDMTAKLASAVYRTDPLSPEQTGRLMQIFAQASLMGRGGNPNQGGTINWDAIVAEANGVLSPAQVAGLTVVRRNFEYQQAVQKLSRPAANAPSGTKTPPSDH
jgi:hypothetical protein